MREYIEVKVSSTRSVKGLNADIGIDAVDASYTKEVNDSAIWRRHVGRLRGSREHRITLEPAARILRAIDVKAIGQPTTG